MFLRPGYRFFATCLPKVNLHPNYAWAAQRLSQIPKQFHIILSNFDCGGLTVDNYCLTPYFAFKATFADIAPDLTHDQITGPMGMDKKTHIGLLLKQIFRSPPTGEEIEARYALFLSLLRKNIARDSIPTPFTIDTLKFHQANGILTGGTTGYDLETATLALTELEKVVSFDAFSAAGIENNGLRLQMLHQNMTKLGIPRQLISQTAFYTDSREDLAKVREGLEQPWLFAVRNSSTHVRIESREALANMSEEELEQRRKEAEPILESGRPHCILRDMSEVPLAIVAASKAMMDGLTPMSIRKLELCYPPSSHEVEERRNLSMGS